MGDERTITYDRLIKLDPLADVSPSHVLTIWLRDEKHIVSVDISRSALVSLEHRMSGLEHHCPDPVLLAGLRRMEASLASGMALDEIQSITFMSQDVDEVVQVIRESRQCVWQNDMDGALHCRAAADPRARATTRADCARCCVPDARWICHDFVHPVIRDAGTFDDPHARMLVDARCNSGKGEAGKDCQPSGNKCWSRVARRLEAKPAASIINPSRPFTNRRILVGLVEGAKGYTCWYERHMPAKVLEILADGLPESDVSSVRILSGPLEQQRRRSVCAQLDRFKKEFGSVDAEWRELPTADRHHDRVFIDSMRAVNMPPLNTALKGDTCELLQSSLNLTWFDGLWCQATSLQDAS